MDNKAKIKKLYFEDKLKVTEIADVLNMTKQRVSKVLTTEFNKDYLTEKENRKKNNEKKRKRSKADKKKEMRGYRPGDISIEELRIQQAMSARELSKQGKMSSRAAVYSNLNAYTSNGRSLVYNNKIGARPFDLPRSFPLQEKPSGRVSLSIDISR